MATERVGALRYDVILNASSMKKGANDARSALKTFRDGMKGATTDVERYQAGIKNLQKLSADGSITREQGLTILKQLNKELEKAGYKKVAHNKFEKTHLKILQDEGKQLAENNAIRDQEQKNAALAAKHETDRSVKRRNRSQADHRAVMDRQLQIQRANAKGHRLVMLNMRERMRALAAMSPGMQAGIFGNIAGAAGASGATIGAVRGAAMLGAKFAAPVAAVVGLGLAAKSAIVQADRLKKITIDLTVLMDNNADSAGRMVNQFQELARKTPLSTAVLAEGARQLLSFGRASSFVVDDLTKLATIAGGDTERLKLLTKAFADVTAAGKLQGQELRQFTNQGFNPIREMVDMTGESYSKLRKQMEEGGFTADMTSDTLSHAAERYSGRLEASMDTVTAQWEKFKGLMAEIAAEEGEATGLHSLAVILMKGLNNFAANAKQMGDNAVDDVAEFARGDRFTQILTSLGNDIRYALDPDQVFQRPGKKKQGFFENTRKTWSDLRKGIKKGSVLTKEQIQDSRKQSNWTKKRLDLEEKYSELLGEETGKMVKIRHELMGLKDQDLMRVEAAKDLRDAIRQGGDRGIQQAEENLKIVEEIARVRDRTKELKESRKREIEHENNLYKSKKKTIDDIRKRKEEDARKEFQDAQKLAELARKSGGPSDDFTAAGTDYKFVQQRRGELEAKRLEEQANKKRESMDEDRNTLISKMLEMLDLNHTEMINKLQAVN